MAEVDTTKYPKAKYHAKQEPRLVLNPEEEAALGVHWHDRPDLSDEPKPLTPWPKDEEESPVAAKRRGRPPKEVSLPN